MGVISVFSRMFQCQQAILKIADESLSAKHAAAGQRVQRAGEGEPRGSGQCQHGLSTTDVSPLVLCPHPELLPCVTLGFCLSGHPS